MLILLTSHILDSVDLLLKEMNQDSSDTKSINDKSEIQIQIQNPNSLNNSPTKPLNFPNSSSVQSDKEFNSSTDTYTSDTDSQKLLTSEEKEQLKNTIFNNNISSDEQKKNLDLLNDKNFSLEEYSKMDSKYETVNNSIEGNNDFLFTTNLSNNNNSSEITLNNQPQDQESNNIIDQNSNNIIDQKDGTTTPNYSNNSPSKSIMKRSNSSPRKNVAFTNSNPEIHHYFNKSLTIDSNNTSSDNQNSSNDENSFINNLNTTDTTTNNNNDTDNNNNNDTTNFQHRWNEVNNKSSMTSGSSSDNESSTPPLPPPHTSDTKHSFQSILNEQIENNNNQKILDSTALNNLKLNHKSFTNLSLNEKLDIYLSNKNNNNLNSLPQHDLDLDQHLTNLNNATKYNTDSNIHYLSLNLQNHIPENIENPLNSLTNANDYRLKSGGSSQSSLQSLVASNRTLQSNVDFENNGNKGIQLNDGIQGFPDHLVQALLPKNNRKQIDDEDILMMSKNNNQVKSSLLNSNLKNYLGSDDDEFHDSFDNSYNTTEKSIMNLLQPASTSNSHLPVSDNISKSPLKDVSSETNSNNDVNDITKKSTIDEVNVKLDPSAQSNDHQSTNEIKSEIDDKVNVKPEHKEEVSLKSETDDKISVKPETDDSINIKPEADDNISVKAEIADKISAQPKIDDSINVKPEVEKKIKPETDIIAKSEIDDKSSIKSDFDNKFTVKSEPKTDISLKPESEIKSEIIDNVNAKNNGRIKSEPDSSFREPQDGKVNKTKSVKSEPIDSISPKTTIKLESIKVKSEPIDVIEISSDSSYSSLNRSVLQEPVNVKSTSSLDLILVRSEPLDPISIKSEAFDDIFDKIEDKKIEYDDIKFNNKYEYNDKKMNHDNSKTEEEEDDDNFGYAATTKLESASYGFSLDPKDIKLIKSESSDGLKNEQSSNIKDEPTNFIKHEQFEGIKHEPSDYIKSEPSNFIKNEPSNYIKNEPFDHEIAAFKNEDNDRFSMKTELDSKVFPVKIEKSISPNTIVKSEFKEDPSMSSNDGDNEDNDDLTENELATSHHHKEVNPIVHSPLLGINEDDRDDLSLVSSDDYKDASDIMQSKTLAPPRIDEAIDATTPPSPVRRSLLEKASASNTAAGLVTKKISEPIVDKANTNEEDTDILANSSNIAPPEGLVLPPIEPTGFASFEDITRQIEEDKDSFEESLSAEHEADPKPTNFISIWHTQDRKKKFTINSSISEIFNNHEIVKESHSPEVHQQEQFKLPPSLQPRKFKEVNVMSRRVVSPDFEDLQVSGFLPDISHDSGFGNPFKSYMKNTVASSMELSNFSNTAGNRRSMTPLSTKNVLSNIDNDPTLLEPPAPSALSKRYSLGPDFAATYRQNHALLNINDDNLKGNQTQKRSRFKVPSFEIKRSNSALSPKNQYNDIFNDTIVEAPTIKSHGMKTLPSMDRDDVKKILEAKRVISQEEYSKFKLLGNTKKNSIINEPDDKYDSLQQHASIYDVSMDSSPQAPNDKEARMPHITTELLRNPTALLAKEQIFNDSSVYLDDSQGFINDFNLKFNNSQENNLPSNSSNNTVVQNISKIPVTEHLGFPEPHPELINSPKNRESNIFKTPPKELNNLEQTNDILDLNDTIDNDLEIKYRIINNSPRKSKVGTPKKNAIKVGSPIRVVKNGSSITGIEIESPSRNKGKVNKNINSFKGDELINNKIRDMDGKQIGTEQHKPSSVSVPSTTFTNRTDPSNASSATLLNNQQPAHQYRNILAAPHESDQLMPLQNNAKPDDTNKHPLQERGKLFLRVIGFKNIELPEIQSHKGNFTISLDNGVHCIKTPHYNLDSHNVSINKEFELTVGESLEFILTMKASYERPRGKLVEVKERKVVKSKNKFSRMFGSKDIITTTRFVQQEAKDSWANKVAQDGSFARCYVDLDQYENQITGKASSFNITCFNEWETHKNAANQQTIKSQPYRIGQLEVQMLFVPRTDELEVLPNSIKSAYEGINEIRNEIDTKYEGYLHQEGGDCEIWKKRFFTLQGTSLIAHSEFSHKTRAKINLAKVVDIIYVDKENIEKGINNFRNFSDILLVEHAFKIKFANGEIIDFGAPNKQEKDIWISCVENIIHRNKFRRQPWVKLMLENETTNRPSLLM